MAFCPAKTGFHKKPRITLVTDKNVGITNYVYDEEGNVIKTIDVNQSWWEKQERNLNSYIGFNTITGAAS